jgi:hypothetical protein
MATRIVFAAGRGEHALSIGVEEGGDEVFESWKAAAGQPFALTETLNSGKIWINPATVAYWEEAGEAGSVHFPP